MDTDYSTFTFSDFAALDFSALDRHELIMLFGSHKLLVRIKDKFFDRLDTIKKIDLVFAQPLLLSVCDLRNLSDSEKKYFAASYKKRVEENNLPKFSDIDKAVILMRIPEMAEFFDPNSLRGAAWLSLIAHNFPNCKKYIFRDFSKNPYIYETKKYFECSDYWSWTVAAYLDSDNKVRYSLRDSKIGIELHQLWGMLEASVSIDINRISDGFYNDPITNESIKITDYFEFSQLRNFLMLAPEVLFRYHRAYETFSDGALQEIAFKFYRRMMTENPEYADKVNLADIFWHNRDKFVKKFFKYANKFYYGDLDGLGIQFILQKFPELAYYCDLTKLNDEDWQMLLKEQPQLAPLCPLKKFGNDSAHMLLRNNPELADKVDWDSIDGFVWSFILRDSNKYDSHCNWEKLNYINWSYLLPKRPDLADKCPWDKIPFKYWHEFVKLNIEYAQHFDYGSLSIKDLKKILLYSDSALLSVIEKKYPEKYKKLIAGGFSPIKMTIPCAETPAENSNTSKETIVENTIENKETPLRKYTVNPTPTESELTFFHNEWEAISPSERQSLNLNLLISMSELSKDGKTLFGLALLYLDGKDIVNADANKAIELMYKSASFDYYPAEKFLSDAYLNGVLFTRNVFQGICYLLRAIDHGLKADISKLLSESPDLVRICRGMLKNNNESMLEMTEWCANFAEDESISEEERKNYYNVSMHILKILAQNNFIEAQYILGMLYTHSAGKFGELDNKEIRDEGARLLAETTKKGYSTELSKIRVKYFKRENDTKPDKPKSDEKKNSAKGVKKESLWFRIKKFFNN